MSKLKYEISEETQTMLKSFKQVADTILEEKMEFSSYLDLVIQKGIKSMMSDIIPKECSAPHLASPD